MHDDVKKENRKALPKFFLVVLAAALFGGVLGFLSGWMGRSSVREAVPEALDYIVGGVLPWLIPAAFLALLSAAVWQYRRARRLFESWDGETEDIADQVSSCLNWVLLLTSVTMVLDFFLLSAASYSRLPYGALVNAAVFLAAVVAIMLLQQRVVDLTRRMNPEKRGSVYDMNFQKKWLDSCDEAERQQIGQASYRAYRAGGTACVALWAALLVLDFTFEIGVLPSFVALLLWGVLQVSYILECIRLSGR